MKGNRWIQLANGHASIGWPSIKGGDNAASFGHYASIMIGRLSRPDPPRTIPSIAIRETVNSPRRLLYESLLSPSSTILLHCTVYIHRSHTDLAQLFPIRSGEVRTRCTSQFEQLCFPFISILLKINLHPLISFVSSIRDIYKKEKFYFDNSNFLIYKVTR